MVRREKKKMTKKRVVINEWLNSALVSLELLLKLKNNLDLVVGTLGDELLAVESSRVLVCHNLVA